MTTEDQAPPAKKFGSVKWYAAAKRYGFIVCDNGGDVFVHESALKEAGIAALEQRQRVSFDIADNNGRPLAVNLAVLPTA